MVITVGKPERVDRMGLHPTRCENIFPDGSPFEGVGVGPDVEDHTSALDLRRGNDPVMAKAMAMIAEGKN